MPEGLANSTPRLMFDVCLGECVRSMGVGTVSLGEYKDLVVSTFSGKVLGFTADPAAQDATGAHMSHLCPEGGVAPGAAAAKRQELGLNRQNEDTSDNQVLFSHNSQPDGETAKQRT